MKKLIAGLCAGAVCLTAVFAAACDGDGDKKPEKLKDGISLSIEEEKSATVNLSEYISIPEGTNYVYTVASSSKTVAEVSLSENIATITALSVGDTVVTASVAEISVEFAVKVTEKAPVQVDKTALKAEIDKEVSAQGEYTEESYNAYRAKFEAAKTVYEKAEATQEEVDNACEELKKAQSALALRKPAEVANANKTLSVLGGGEKEIVIADYIDENGLSDVQYTVTCDKPDIVSAGDIAEGKVTLTAQTVTEDTDVAVILKAVKNGETEVVLSLKVLSEPKPVLKQPEVTKKIDIYNLTGNALSLNLAENIVNDYGLSLIYAAVSSNSGVSITVTDDLAECVLNGTYNETPAEEEITVTVTYGDGKTLEYIYKLSVFDTGVYRVQNGGFDDGLTGWTLSDTEKPIGEISTDEKFWGDYPIFNNGKYFRGDGVEGNIGTLTSSEFKIGGINKIMFMLGAAGAEDCYLTLEKPDGTVLAVWRNVKFADVGGWTVDQIGVTQFALNLVTYVADLSAWEGQTVKLVLNDGATGGFGFFTFDELVTYYESEDDLPAGATLAVNELADKTALQEKVTQASAIVKGDYTDESFNALQARINEANELLGKKGATAGKLADKLNEIENAVNALALRVPVSKDVNRTVSVKSGNSLTIDPSVYVDDKGLSSITYELTTVSDLITVDGLNITAETVDEDKEGTLFLTVKYKGETVLSVTLIVKITSGDKPVLNDDSVEKNIDIYSLTDKTKIKLDFTENVSNPANLTLVYTVKIGENSEAITLDSENCYEYALNGTYTDVAVPVAFTVEVGSTENAHKVNYVYTLNIKDTTAYRVVNGDFETGDLTGWTLSGDKFGKVSNLTGYWGANISYNKDGEYLFTGLEGQNNSTDPNLEGAQGTLKSSNFVLKANGWISFKLGAAKNETTGIRVVNAQTGEVIGKFHNTEFGKDGNEGVLIQYVYRFDNEEDLECYIEIYDEASGDWGLVSVDSIVTYYEDAPALDGAVTATNKK